MAIVSRRVLQRLILDSERFLTSAQRERLATGINRGGPRSLAFEWEVLVLTGLSRLTDLQHEPLLHSRPDILATVHNSSDVFIADIATHFLESTDERNPVHALQRLVSDRAWERHGMSGNGFRLEVEGDTEGPRGKQRMQLRLPPKRQLHAFFLEHLAPFVDAVASSRKQARMQAIERDGAQLTISFDPAERFASARYPSYTVHYSRTSNPVFSILKSKTEQLKAADFDGPRCVILCGADALLPRRATGPGFGLAEITAEFFRQNSTLSAVLTICSGRPPVGSGITWITEVYLNAAARHPLGTEALAALTSFVHELPQPIRDGVNALNHLEFWHKRRGQHYYGDFTFTRSMDQTTTIRVSSRELMEFLAGRIDHGAFVASMGGSPEIAAVFARHLKAGRLLQDVSFERRADRDDDWVVFKFGPPDPALAPLKAT